MSADRSSSLQTPLFSSSVDRNRHGRLERALAGEDVDIAFQDFTDPIVTMFTVWIKQCRYDLCEFRAGADIVEDFVISGSKTDAIKKIERYITAGVTHFIFRDFSPDRKASLITLSKEIIPYFRDKG